MATTPTLRRKPEARAETVEDLIEKVVRGLVRVPIFQRGLRWEAKDVVDLLDSVYRGYPIGSLLFWQRRAEASKITVGPLVIEAPETSSALWVVDGQQRLTAIAGTLARQVPIPRAPIDPHVVYFDPQSQLFQSPPSEGTIPTTWVPLPLLLDATRLSEWMIEWAHQRDAHLRQAVFEAGKRLREYPVPLYIVDSDNEAILKEIFYRLNTSGKKLKWNEVHDALFGHVGAAPSTLDGLADALSELGMGRIERDTLLQCLLSVRGLDVTLSLAEHRRRDPEVLKDAISEALPSLRRALSFLRESAEIPHVRLLPRVLPLVILTRFFALHPEPSPRTRELLSRWVWRHFLTVGGYDERTVLRRGVRAIRADDEEGSTQELLKLAPERATPSITVPATYDARTAANRVVLAALATLRPRNLFTGEMLDVASIVEKDQATAFRAVLSSSKGVATMAKTAANRIIHSDERGIRPRLIEIGREPRLHDGTLASHAISHAAVHALARGDSGGFLTHRKADVTRLVNEVGERLAAWSHSDRPSIDHLLAQARMSP